MAKKILQLQLPQPGEPLCSGMEIIMGREQHIYLSHFHTIVTVKNARPWTMPFASPGSRLAIECTVTINGSRYETQTFELAEESLGKTLFCAGFPCLTITGLSKDIGDVTVTISEIVQPCDPESCPWDN